ncbi:MAG: ABC transporter permease [Acidobacteriia bacterium]|nr:ABC transporter permease [Terriglobia bacterium]
MGWSRFFRRSFWDDERAREIQSYIEIETDENIARGMHPHEARCAACRKFGNPVFIREEIFRMNTIGFIEMLWQDMRHAFRSLCRNRGFATTAVLTLALGIGANTTVFSVVDAAWFRPLPYGDPNRLVTIAWVAARGSAEQVTFVGGESLQEMEDWRAQKQIFAAVEPYSMPRVSVGPSGLPDPIAVVWISTGMLDLLGAKPKLGRGFLPEEGQAGRDQVALLSYGYWTREFGADPAVLGKTIVLDNHHCTVIGIMPEAFQFGSKPNAWVPWTPKSGGDLSFIGRLRPGLGIEQAEREAALVSDRIGYDGRVSWARMTPEFRSFGERMSARYNKETRTALLIMMGSVGFVLLIACANVANLMLSRGATLRHEIAIRAAIGATRGRLVCHFLIESMVISAVGALAALLLAWWMTHLIPALLPAGLRRFFQVYEVALSARVFAFTAAVTVLVCILSGLTPALRAAHGGVIAGLTGTNRVAGVTRATRRLHAAFQILQVSLALVLLCGGGLLANSFVRIVSAGNGFDTNNLCLVRISLPSDYLKGADLQAFYDQLPALVKKIQGVLAATISGGTPATTPGFGSGRLFPEESGGAGPEPRGGDLFYVRPDFFSTLRLPLIAGRSIGPVDGPSSPPVAIIDQRTAEYLWPGQSAVGRRYRTSSRAPWVTVVGVAAPVKTSSFTDPKAGQIYKPLSQSGSALGNCLVIRTAGNPGPVMSQVRAMAAALDPKATIRTAATFEELYAAMDARNAATPRFYLILMMIFAGVALATAAVGIYGVLSYSVAQRTAEIGVRMALGATTRDIRRLVTRTMLAPVCIGAGTGVIASFWLTRFLQSLLYQISPHDPVTIISVVGFLLFVALVAGWLPTRRASRVDPMTALRVE